MDILGIAQQGLQQAQGQFEKAAQHVVQAGLNTAPSQTPSDTVSLSDAAVSVLSAQNQFETDLTVAHTGKAMEKATLALMQ